MTMDKDLQSIQEARDLLRKAKAAQHTLTQKSPKEIDAIVKAMAMVGKQHAERLAQLAVEETGLGIVKDKIVKNLLATETVYNFIKDLTVLGIITERKAKGLVEIGVPMGIVVGIIPTTNPTSTTLYKAIISVKSGNAVVFSPHPSAVKCISESARLMAEAATTAGAPPGLISCLSLPTKEATAELMHNELTSVILATGGTGLVKAAYSSGKPAFGVGPGNVPVFIERSANIQQAVADIIQSKTFDNGTVCASEQAVITERVSSDSVRQAFQSRNAVFLTEPQILAVSKVLVKPDTSINPKLVGQSAWKIAAAAGIEVPQSTTVLIAALEGVGKEYPLSGEKLSPVLAFYTVENWEAACDLSLALLTYGGLGHSFAIHSRNEQIIREFGLRKPAFRILVNTPSTHGAVGVTTGLDPALTLGCGTWGGNITGDNVTPLHLINRKRIAYDLRTPTTLSLEQNSVVSSKLPEAPSEAAIKEIVRKVIAGYQR